MRQTIENIAAIRCEEFARAAESLASALRETGTKEARQHASDVVGAAKQEGAQPVSHDMYRRMVPQPAVELEPCPVCGANAFVWEFSEEPTHHVQRVVMCENGERFGPQDGIRNDGCLLYMPPEQFYHGRGADAARYWNEYAKAISAQRRKRSWERHSIFREETRP